MLHLSGRAQFIEVISCADNYQHTLTLTNRLATVCNQHTLTPTKRLASGFCPSVKNDRYHIVIIASNMEKYSKRIRTDCLLGMTWYLSMYLYLSILEFNYYTKRLL